MPATHQLEPSLFEGLASGGGGAAAIEALRSAQLSKHLLLVGHLLQRWPGPGSERDAIADALERSRTRDPWRFSEVLGAPLVGAWCAIANRAEQGEGAALADFRHLGAVTVVACATAGVDASAEVPVREGVVSVPGLGAALVDAGTARLVALDGRLSIHVGPEALQIPEDGAETKKWWPVRHLVGVAAGQEVRLALDDLDPYRHGHHVPPAPRLTAAEVDLWRIPFANAWRLLAECLPDRAGELAAGLRTLVPLVQEDERAARSATIRHAFGVFGLTRPPSAAEFAVTLVHEFQHSKLSAILDLMPLTDPDDKGRYFAPWRVDPRPLAGLLQGVYAFAGVADTWRGLREVEPSACGHFAEARLQVDRGLAAVECSGALTPAGEVVAVRLREVTDVMLAEPVPAAIARAAEQKLEHTRQQWASRNPAA